MDFTRNTRAGKAGNTTQYTWNQTTQNRIKFYYLHKLRFFIFIKRSQTVIRL